jgi:hypothetical protein
MICKTSYSRQANIRLTHGKWAPESKQHRSAAILHQQRPQPMQPRAAHAPVQHKPAHQALMCTHAHQCHFRHCSGNIAPALPLDYAHVHPRQVLRTHHFKMRTCLCPQIRDASFVAPLLKQAARLPCIDGCTKPAEAASDGHLETTHH